MNLKYTYEMDGGYFVGCLDDYPGYYTQGENLGDFEENLLDIYELIQNGTLDVNNKHAGCFFKEVPRPWTDKERNDAKRILEEIADSGEFDLSPFYEKEG